MRSRTVAAGLALLGSTLLQSCAEGTSLAGSSTSTGNAQATGIVRTREGHPARLAFVECRPDSLASWEPLEEAWNVRTDTAGRYLCKDLPVGAVGIQAFDPASGLSHWHAIRARTGTVDSTGIDTLERPGDLLVALAPATFGTLHLSGLGRYLAVQGEPVVRFPDLPAGWRGVVRLASDTGFLAVLDSASVRSGRTDSAGFTRTATLLSVPLAGGLKGALRQFPVLIRLDSTWTGFVHSLPDGSDLRLSLPDGKALPVAVAAWDKVARTGALWTVLDSLAAPGDSVRLVLGSGIPVPTSAPAQGFTAANGWIAAWPLGDAGDTALDRTGSFPGLFSKATSTEGAIGKATRFNGKSSQVVVPNSTSGALAQPEGGPYTYSCWARLAVPSVHSYLMGHGNYGPGLAYRAFATGNAWMASEYRSSPLGSDYVTAPADSGTWTHLAMTVSGSSMALYVNGTRQQVDSGTYPSAVARKSLPFVIGTSIDTVGLTSTYSHFGGDLSEVWVQSVARSSDWIRLTAANQAPGAPKARIRPQP